MSNNNNYRFSFLLLTALFFLWGFITVFVDALIPRLRELFTLTYFEAGLVQFAFFGAYFLLSIPFSFLLGKLGYKRGILLGLIVLSLGCVLFYFAASFRTFGVFLVAYFTIAAGMTLLQVAANPYVAVLGSESGASSRLNLAQAFNSLGTSIAPAIGAMFVLSDTIKNKEEIAALTSVAREAYFEQESAAVQMPFLGLALFILLIVLIFFFAKLPQLIQSDVNRGYWKALSLKRVRLGVIGIFFYVGAEVAIGSYLVNYFMDMGLPQLITQSHWLKAIASKLLSTNIADTDAKAIVGVFVTFYWSAAMVGRFLGAYFTKVFSPARVLSIFAACAVICLYLSVFTTGEIAMWSILSVGLFNSIMFPTLFAMTIDGQKTLKPAVSGLLCTAIVGGAIVPPLFGLAVDLLGFKWALAFLSLCYAYIYYFAQGKFNSKAYA